MIEVRRAEAEDVEWVIELAQRSVVFGMPRGRPIPEDEVRQTAARNLEALRQPDPRVLILLAHEGSLRLGYLILLLDERDPATGTRQSFIYDLAVDPTHWGRYVVHRLVEAAARETAAHGLRFMVGEVTADNRRTLVQAQRLGFAVEACQVAAACSADGLAALPGRTSPSAYEDSRARRRGRPPAGRTPP